MVGLKNGGSTLGTLSSLVQIGNPLLHACRPNVADGHSPPAGFHMDPPRFISNVECGRLSVTSLAVQPCRTQLADSDPRVGGGDILALELRHLHRRGEDLGVALR